MAPSASAQQPAQGVGELLPEAREPTADAGHPDPIAPSDGIG